MAKDSNINRKPLLFGDANLDATAIEDIEKFEGDNFDYSYVPGYSEQRRINEHRVRDGYKPVPMDKLYWARVNKTDGSDVDYREAVTTARLGFRACTLDDLKERGWGMPPAAHVGADGLIRMQDTALAIVDFDRADKNRKRQERMNADFEGRDIMPDARAGITGEARIERHEGRLNKADALKAAKTPLLAD